MTDPKPPLVDSIMDVDLRYPVDEQLRRNQGRPTVTALTPRARIVAIGQMEAHDAAELVGRMHPSTCVIIATCSENHAKHIGAFLYDSVAIVGTSDDVVKPAAAPEVPAAPVVPLAKKHGGMTIDYSGVLGRLAEFGPALRKLTDEPDPLPPRWSPDAEAVLSLVETYAHVLDGWGPAQLMKHLEHMATRFYAGDLTVVDEFLQLWCLDQDRPKAPAGEVSDG